MEVYISMVLFLLIGLFLFLALYDSGSTSTSTSTCKTPKPYSNEYLRSEPQSPNISMNLGTEGTLTTKKITAGGDITANGIVLGEEFCIPHNDGKICLTKDNFAALRHFVTGSFQESTNIFTPYTTPLANSDPLSMEPQVVGLVNLVEGDGNLTSDTENNTAVGNTTQLSIGGLRVSGYSSFQSDGLPESIWTNPQVYRGEKMVPLKV